VEIELKVIAINRQERNSTMRVVDLVSGLSGRMAVSRRGREYQNISFLTTIILSIDAQIENTFGARYFAQVGTSTLP
jgi:hypothetical protein